MFRFAQHDGFWLAGRVIGKQGDNQHTLFYQGPAGPFWIRSLRGNDN